MLDRLKVVWCSLLLGLLISPVMGQNQTNSNIKTVGLQYKPIVPSELFNTGPSIFTDEEWDVTITPLLGHSYGMVIRNGFTDRFSLEVGINQTLRDYRVEAAVNDTAFSGKSIFRLVGYEIPVQGLVYVRLSERMYMNNAFGLSFNMFASDVETSDEFFYIRALRSRWLQLGLTANVGFEYRTESSGFFYLGASLHRPLTSIASTYMRYEAVGRRIEQSLPLNGNYLTIDLRYFFHEEADKKKRRRSN